MAFLLGHVRVGHSDWGIPIKACPIALSPAETRRICSNTLPPPARKNFDWMCRSLQVLVVRGTRRPDGWELEACFTFLTIEHRTSHSLRGSGAAIVSERGAFFQLPPVTGRWWSRATRVRPP